MNELYQLIIKEFGICNEYQLINNFINELKSNEIEYNKKRVNYT